MATSLKKFAALAVFACACTAAQAELLPDPTRPADLLSAGDAAAGDKAASDDGLHTIIISPDRRSAIINGQQVPLGGKLGNERLMAVCEDSVVLQGADGRREVSLYPDVAIDGRRNKRCAAPVARQSAGVARVHPKKSKKIGHAPLGGAAQKKEKSCK